MRLLTLARNLRRRKAREGERLFVAEGVRAVEELLRSPLAIRGVLVAPQLDGSPRGAALRPLLASAGVAVTAVDEREFSSAAETDSPQGVLAVAETPDRSLSQFERHEPLRLLVLDALQDPGNVGTILRTAAAFGVTATVALPGTVDLWNAKVVRSAMGAHFTHPAFHCTWDDLVSFLSAGAVPLWGADGGGELIGTSAPPSRLALAVGNEGAGLTAAVRGAVERLVSVPITSDVDSLNVAVAAGILLHQLRP